MVLGFLYAKPHCSQFRLFVLTIPPPCPYCYIFREILNQLDEMKLADTGLTKSTIPVMTLMSLSVFVSGIWRPGVKSPFFYLIKVFPIKGDFSSSSRHLKRLQHHIDNHSTKLFCTVLHYDSVNALNLLMGNQHFLAQQNHTDLLRNFIYYLCTHPFLYGVILADGNPVLSKLLKANQKWKPGLRGAQPASCFQYCK